ncbi:hypothetical protein BDW02DRAFT_650469 [Decorospora gaudefroyi]|uniref:G domain-containing protein n=1 Tax=Decorospora gaudefroyi TaxID=184978 RepID=A0A6A5K8A8_9PLEO|nr:hypothetical protein BDW02DRAFT_650469 [Decorospora gaudefroyi]
MYGRSSKMHTAFDIQGAQPISAEDVFIAVMGMTGAGKSTFIEHCTKTPKSLSGHELISCTSQVSIHTTTILGRTVHLLDTPGFNDSQRSDSETLQELAYWLTVAYERNIKLSGLVYLHCIRNNRFSGSAVRALDAFKEMCGEEAFCGVVLATTMWDTVSGSDNELAKAEKRHAEIHEKVRHNILQHGGRTVRLSAVEVDAKNILEHIISKDRRLTLAFQQQLVDENRLIHETDAGQVLFRPLRERYQSRKTSPRGSHDRMTEMVNTERRTTLRQIGDAFTEISESMGSTEEAIKRTSVALSDIRKTWEDNINRDDEALSATAQLNEQQLQAERDLEASVSLGSGAFSSAEPSSTGYYQTSQASSMLRLERLEREKRALEIQMGQRLNRRYTTVTTRPRGTARIGIVGTGLAVSQLIAAIAGIACVVM